MVFYSKKVVYGPEIIGKVLRWRRYSGNGPRRAVLRLFYEYHGRALRKVHLIN